MTTSHRTHVLLLAAVGFFVAPGLGAGVAASPAAPTTTPGLPVHDDAHKEIAVIVAELKAGAEPAPLYLRRAALERLLGHVDVAVRLLDEAEGLGADPVRLAMERATCASLAGKHAAAAELLTAAITRSPRVARLRRERAGAFAVLRLNREAACDLLVARRLAPTEFTMDDEFALVDACLGYGDSAAALRSLDRAIGRRGPAAVLVARAIRIDAGAGAYDSALRRADELQRAGVARHEVDRLRGDLLRLQGREVDARLAHQRAETARRLLPSGRRRTSVLECLDLNLEELKNGEMR